MGILSATFAKITGQGMLRYTAQTLYTTPNLVYISSDMVHRAPTRGMSNRNSNEEFKVAVVRSQSYHSVNCLFCSEKRVEKWDNK